MLAPYVDVFSPMPYHGRSGMPLEYVRDYAEYFSTRHDIVIKPYKYPRLWPLFQAVDAPRFEPEELSTVLVQLGFKEKIMQQVYPLVIDSLRLSNRRATRVIAASLEMSRSAL